MSQDIVELLLRLAPNCEWVTERTAMREAATLITTLTAERDALVEQAFRDGIAYASMVKVTDVDLAWEQSRARAALSRSEV